MVKITQEMLIKSASHTKRRTNETPAQYLKRLTHIYFQEKNIDEIDNLSNCRSLAVLYLYDNDITVVKNLSFASNLTHLYLQKNRITNLSGLKHLQRLTKLYIGHNEITVVEGLDDNVCLTELHIEHQNLPQGEKLLFDPRTLFAISKSLSILNIAGNNIDELKDLKDLKRLSHLMVEDNQLVSWVDLSETLLEWRFLSKINISGNPLCKDKKSRDKLIIMSQSIVMIDNKEVTESTRQFLQNWYAKKEERRKLRNESKSKSKVDLNYYDRSSDGYLMTNQSSRFANARMDMLPQASSGY